MTQYNWSIVKLNKNRHCKYEPSHEVVMLIINALPSIENIKKSLMLLVH